MPSYGRRSLKRSTIPRRRARSLKASSRSRIIQARRTALRRRRPSVPRPAWTRRTMTRKLTFCQTVTLDPGDSTTAIKTYRANSCYDPDYSGVGHQPRYWDLLTPGWKTYTVLGSKITAEFFPTTTSTAVTPGYFYLYQDGNTFGSSYESAADAREDLRKIISTGPVDGPTKRGYASFSLRKVAPLRGDANFTALVDGNPATQRFFHLVTGGLVGDAQAMTFIVKIDYIVQFSNKEVDVGDS